jgi:hypothetical protein
MSEPLITCPNCKHQIKLTESLAAPLIQSIREDYEQKLVEKDEEVAQREAGLKAQQVELAKARAGIDDLVAEKIDEQRASITADEAKKARRLCAADLETKTAELTELQEVLKQRDAKLQEAQQAQAQLLRKERELDDAKREIDLTIEKGIQQSLQSIRATAKQEAEDEFKLKVAERDQTIASMQKQIEILRRRAEQGSQQLQGEVQELELESVLRARFPADDFEPVPKGEHGGDLVHRVLAAPQQLCGTILWEFKRTKTWTDTWLPKLRENQRAAKADLAVIVSDALPKHVDTFDLIDGVWVAAPRCAIPVALVLRQSIIELAVARQAADGQQTKMEMIYRYLTGPRFRHRVQAIVEKFSDMQSDLDRERKATLKLWSKREEQIRCVIESTLGMYGDLQGIAGKALPEIDGLEGFPALPVSATPGLNDPIPS